MTDHERDEAPVGYCAACGARCLGVWRDCGIGSYEYWGHVEFQEDWRWVSPCCCDEIVPHKENSDADRVPETTD